MRKVNADCASGQVYLSSPALASVTRAYHRIWAWVKKDAPTAISGVGARPTESAKMTVTKLAYRFTGSLGNNDHC
jgi:hypothetical protein